MKYIKELIQASLNNSHSYKELMINLGIKPISGNYKTIQKYISLYELDISHFKAEEIRRNSLLKSVMERRIPDEDVFILDSIYNRKGIKNRIYKQKLLEIKCSLCGQDENWKGKKISLILDHINGINNDNRLENLRLLCPNCNATLDTHCGKNHKKKYYCKCGKEKHKTSEQCNHCKKLDKRKVRDRPSKEILKKEIVEIGYSATGRKYGVSDNCIRKWIK